MQEAAEYCLCCCRNIRDLRQGMRTVDACLRIVWQCRLGGGLKFWALENPVGYLRQFLGIPGYTFYQWEYGTMQSKRTDIWGYFRQPVLMVKTIPEELCNPALNANARSMGRPKCPPEYAHLGLDRAAIRAITPAGFAEAFFRRNR
jgi:hypothetical protein